MNKNKRENKVLKNAFKVFKIAGQALLFAGTVFVGHQGYVASKLLENEGKSNEEVLKSAEIFDANLDLYMKDILNSKKVRRLANNGDEPIYVTISPDFSLEEKRKIIDAFSYVEEVFKTINPNYRFDYVNNNLMNVFAGKATIDVEKDNNIKSEGLARPHGFNVFKREYLLNSSITITSENEMKKSRFEDVVLHELMHLFQLQDVYSSVVNKEIATTYMFVEPYLKYIPELTPQDYRGLQAVYNNTHFEDGKINEKAVAKTLELIEHFEENYYAVRASFFRDNYPIKYNYKTITKERASNLNFKAKNTVYEFNVELKDGVYTFTVINAYKKEKLLTHEGNYIVVNGIVVLKDVTTKRIFHNSLHQSGYDRVVDLMVFKVNESDYHILDVSEVASDRFHSTLTNNVNKTVNLRNMFFEYLKQLDAINNDNENIYFHQPTKQTFSIEMDDETDSLGLFR